MRPESRLSRIGAETASQFPDVPRIVAFRNILVHGYAVVDDALVWDVATIRVPQVLATVARLIGSTGD